MPVNHEAVMRTMAGLRPYSTAAVLNTVALGCTRFEEIVRFTTMGRSQVSGGLTRLGHLGLVVHDEAARTYTLGPSLLTDSPTVGRPIEDRSNDYDLKIDPFEERIEVVDVSKLAESGTKEAFCVDFLANLPFPVQKPARIVEEHKEHVDVLIECAKELAARPEGKRGRNPAGLLNYMVRQRVAAVKEQPAQLTLDGELFTQRREAQEATEKDREAWQQTLGVLQQRVVRHNFNTYLAGTEVVGRMTDGALAIKVPTVYAAEQATAQLAGHVKRALSEVVGGPVGVRFVV